MNHRLANRDDVAAMLAISNWAALHTPANFAIEPETLEAWTRSWEETQRMYPWLVAMAGTDILGFAKASPHKSRCAYAWSAELSVYVHPNHHGKGVGRSLYDRLIPILKAQGYVTLLAGITTPNPASERLHTSVGFRRVGLFERVGWKFDQWHDVSYWQCNLRDDRMPPSPIQPVAAVMAVESLQAG
jgi:phosphinothricin acetyltransferase